MNSDEFISTIKDFGNKVRNEITSFEMPTELDLRFVISNLDKGILKGRKLLSFNEDFLLHSPIIEDMERTLKYIQMESNLKPLITEQHFSILESLKKLLPELTEHFNSKVINLKRMAVTPSEFYIGENIELTNLEQIHLINKTPNMLSDFMKEKIAVKKLNKNDFVKSHDGKGLDFLNFMIPDGKVFPFSILMESTLVKYGFPIGLYTEKDQNINVNSIKYISYKDPKINKIKDGFYFEVEEAPGHLGQGGINGIISPIDVPLVILNYTKGEAYFIGINNFKNQMPTSSCNVCAA